MPSVTSLMSGRGAGAAAAGFGIFGEPFSAHRYRHIERKLSHLTLAQRGTGSWDPLLGISYTFFARPFSLYASIQGSAPLRRTSDFRASPSMRTTTAAQYQLVSWLAPRVGIDTRLDARAYEEGRPERDSSGFIAFVSGELLLSPTTDLLLVLAARVPVVQALAGYHREGPILGGAVAYDF